MNLTLPKKPRYSLRRLSDFQRSVIGDWELEDTVCLRPRDIPEIGLAWAGYIFRCTWENQIVSVSAICPESEYMVVFVFADNDSFEFHIPARCENPEKERQPCESYSVLLGNISLRMAQLGLAASVQRAQHLDQFLDYPVNFKWSEILLKSLTKDGETEILYGIDRTGKKAVVYVNSANGTRLDKRFVANADQISSAELRWKHHRNEILESLESDEFLELP